MNAYEIWKVAAAVIASIGGGGAIVFALSGYLGKIWADRGLAKQKQEYAQLNIEFTHQLELASKQVQMELDRLGHLHKLRTESEFHKLGALWTSIARLRFAFSALPNEAYDLQGSDKEEHHQSCLNFSQRFYDRWLEAFQLWNDEALAIPKDIFDMAANVLNVANEELPHVLDHRDPFDGTSTELSDTNRLKDFLEKPDKRNKDFHSKSETLLTMMRKYLDGKNALRVYDIYADIESGERFAHLSVEFLSLLN